MDELYESLRRSIRGVVKLNEPMKKHTTFGIGGPADLWVEPETQHELFVLIDTCRKQDIPCFIIGRGSNLLVRDGGIRGVVINLNRACERLSLEDNAIEVGAGTSLIALVKFAAHHALQGLEFCAGIPASVGGALATNAGAWGSGITEFVETVLVYDPVRKEKNQIARDAIDSGYRRSSIVSHGIILEARFLLQPGDTAEISARINQYLSQRSQSQPLHSRSAGSVFKNPPGEYAGAIIERLGFKGYTHGGAAVSRIHANFIENLNEASAADVLSIISEIKQRAMEVMKIELEEELHIVGEE